MSDFVSIPQSVPRAWQRDGSIRFGQDRLLGILPAPPPSILELLADLESGVTRSRVDRALRSADLNDLELHTTTATVNTLIAHSQKRQQDAPRLRIGVRSANPMQTRLIRTLRESGFLVRVEPDSPSDAPDLVVFSERYLSAPHTVNRWRTAGTPHLMVRFSDFSILVGPVFTDEGPCYGCVNHIDMQGDPEWSYRTPQLVGKAAPSETPLLVNLASVYATMLAQRWQHGDPTALGEQTVLSLTDRGTVSSVTTRQVVFHANCGCAALRQLAS